ncbi:MAG TPA: competence/damage-inducible protein A [Candidatus Eremiobacteraceae bacterium]
MPSAEIITIGTEMLLGQLVDTNTAIIARALADIGVDVRRETSVGDNEASIAAAVSEAIARAEIVVCAGGLGPTVDDMTRKAIAAAVSRPLVCDAESLRHLESMFSRLKRPMTENNLVQAYFPEGAEPLPNPNGSAPGFVVEREGRAVLALPGPPRELQPMLQDHAIPWIERRFAPNAVLVTRVLRTAGLGESDLDSRIADLFREQKNPSIAVLAHPGLVDVKITAKAATREEAATMIGALEPLVRERLGDCVYAMDGGTLESVAGEMLLLHGWTLAVGESCTGGSLAAAITSIPGASSYFRGGVVAYDNEAKRRLLDVEPDLIERHGAVSEEVAGAMALGARAALRADVGISITGVAGPDGGTPEKPVGLVFIGLALPDGSMTIKRLDWPASRDGIQRRAVVTALTMLWRALR